MGLSGICWQRGKVITIDDFEVQDKEFVLSLGSVRKPVKGFKRGYNVVQSWEK